MLTFGIFVNYTRVFPDETSDGLYEDMQKIAILADRVGFDIVWVPEHHMAHMLQVPNCLMNAAVLGQHVKCRVGTAVCVLPYRHPLMWVGEVGQTDRLLGGRLEFGVARGAYRYEFERFGLEFDESKARFEECLRVLEEQWTTDRGTANDGPFYPFPKSYVWPRPIQLPHPPIWVGAQSVPTARWAARKDYDVFHAPFLGPVSGMEPVVEAFREERDQAGLAPEGRRFGVLVQGFVTEKESAVPEFVRLLTMRQRMVTHLVANRRADDYGYVSPDPIENEPSEEEVRNNLPFGTPDEVLAKMLEYESVGADHVLFTFNFGLSTELILESIQLFAERVMWPYRADRGLDRIPLAATVPTA